MPQCPSCSDAGVAVGISQGVWAYACQSCDLWFVDSADRASTDSYDEWYLEESQDIARYQKDMGNAYRRQARALKKFTSGRSIVDVGCGLGIFLKFARDEGWETQGTDVSSGARAAALKFCGLALQRDLSCFNDSSFDVVRVSHVLEHVDSPVPFLVETRRVLKPGGILAVTVPNREPLSFGVMNALRRLKGGTRLTSHLSPPGHVLGLNKHSLKEMIERIGLKEERMFSVSMGSPTFFPMFFDGLLFRYRLRDIPIRQLGRYWLPQFADNVGNAFGRGQWLVGYFRRTN